MASVLDPYFKRMQMELERDFKDQLWIYDRDKCYIGSKEEVLDCLCLKYGQHSEVSEIAKKLQPYNVCLHEGTHFIHAKKMFDSNFKPKQMGDLIEIEGVIWNVIQLTENKIRVQSSNRMMWILKKSLFKMIYSKNSNFDIRDRLQRLLL
jgi:hypothetical protein